MNELEMGIALYNQSKRASSYGWAWGDFGTLTPDEQTRWCNLARLTVKERNTPCVKLTQQGLRRVSEGRVGMVFVVDSFTPAPHNLPYFNAHVRDGRYPQDGHPYCIWTLGEGDYEFIEA